MENEKFTEQESINLINNMIQATKFKMTKGFGNTYLLMGYSTLIISSLVFAALMLTNNNYWVHFLWGLIAIPISIMYYHAIKERKTVKSYIDNAINATWTVITITLIVALVTLIFSGNFANLMLMLALAVILTSLGVMINGFILKATYLTFIPVLSLSIGFGMLEKIVSGNYNMAALFFSLGFSFIFSMIIPGHILNAKAKRSLKNKNYE